MARTPNIDLREDYGRNYIINGNFDFWQRGTSFVSIAGATYKADRWITAEDGAGTYTLSRDTDVPNSDSNYSMLWECTGADVTLDAADQYLIEQRIEGHNFQSLLGKTFTLSFYVKTNKPGNYSVSFVNSGRDRSYTTDFTVNSSNTWERKTITVQHDETGTWLTDNGVGLRVIFGLGVGSDANTSNLDVWEGGSDVRGSSTAANIQDTVGNQFRLAQVQINEGYEALPFRRAGKTIGEELQLCQRYFQASSGEMLFHASANNSNVTTTAYLIIYFPIEMRVAPTITTITPQFITGLAPRRSRTNYFSLIGTANSGSAARIDGYELEAEL